MSDLSRNTRSGFAALGLAPVGAQAAVAIGWVTPTAIQTAVLPAALDGRDVLGLAPTGSGKTAAFLLPLLQRVLADPQVLDDRSRTPRALVLAPTRELAAQIGVRARSLAPQIKTVVAVGGVAMDAQKIALSGGAHLVVATPGRLRDLVEQKTLQLSTVSVLVFDEADRLLDLGFADEINALLALLPVRRQTLMFSATMPDAVAALAEQVLHKPLRCEISGVDGPSAPLIRQRVIAVDTARRTMLLRHLIATEGWDRVLVFVATQYAAEHVAEKLQRAGVAAAAFHGQLSQGRRTQVLADFHDHRLTVLVATDLAARGIDVSQLAAVVNYDLPRSAVDYTHRIGRTGRAGEHGVAMSFLCADAPGSDAHFCLIEKRLKQSLPRGQVSGFEPVALPVPATPHDGTGGIKGRRKSKKDKLRETAAGLYH
ncbi:MAG: DEAD/DEAH box helicase [Thiomonas sp.]